MYYDAPWRMDQAGELESFVGEITTGGAAGATMRLGLYTMDRFMQPKKLVYDSGNIDAGSTGVFTHSPTGGLILPAGWYLPFSMVSATVSFRLLKSHPGFTSLEPTLGASSWQSSHSVARAYGAAPGDGVAWTGASASSTPGFNSRIAALLK